MGARTRGSPRQGRAESWRGNASDGSGDAIKQHKTRIGIEDEEKHVYILYTSYGRATQYQPVRRREWHSANRRPGGVGRLRQAAFFPSVHPSVRPTVRPSFAFARFPPVRARRGIDLFRGPERAPIPPTTTIPATITRHIAITTVAAVAAVASVIHTYQSLSFFTRTRASPNQTWGARVNLQLFTKILCTCH